MSFGSVGLEKKCRSLFGRAFITRVLANDAGSEVLRRAGFFQIRSGSSEYLRTGVGVYQTASRQPV